MHNSFVIINAANFLGTKLIESILEAYPAATIAVVDTEVDNKQLLDFSKDPRISLFNASLYFSQMSIPQGSIVIYNAIYEEGTHTQMLDISINYKALLTKILETNSSCMLLTPLNKPEKKVLDDHIYSLHTLTLEFSKNGLHGKVIALGDIYGPEMSLDETTPLSHLLTLALHAKTISVEKGSEFRYYIYREDAIQGIIHAFSLQDAGTFTLADPFDVSTYALAIRLREITGKKIIRLDNERPDDHLKTLPHILPQWRPVHTLEQGLEETLAYFKIQTAATLPLQQISSQQQDTKPIRNYTPNVSVFRDVPENPIETRSMYDLYKGGSHIKNIQDLREYGDEQEEPKAPRLSFFDRMQSFREKRSTTTKQVTQREVIIGAVFVLILFCMYMFIALPTIKAINAYRSVQNTVNSYTLTKNKDLIQNTHTLSESFASLEWLFSLTHQQSRYANFTNTIGALESFTATQDAYATYRKPIDTAISALPKQNATTSSSLEQLANSTSTESDITTAITLTQHALSAYIPYFPGSIDHLKNVLDDENKQLASIAEDALLLPAILTGNKAYIGVVYQNMSHAPYTDAGITLLSQINIANGIYNGLTTLQSPKHVSSQTIQDFAISVENQYPTTFNGVMVIDQTGIQNLSVLLPEMHSSNPMHILLTHLFSQDAKNLLPTINQLVIDNHIAFFFNNLNVTKNDIMKSIY